MDSIKIVTRFSSMQEEIYRLKLASKSVGFVPTMGALHEGHLTLVDQSKNENDFTVVSIFVNPTQFNNKNDLEKYPRTTDADIALLKSRHCDYLFLPSVDEMYPEGPKSEIWDFGNLGFYMEGKNRPGHFNGVATVVKKLFEAVPADRAYFGKKDYQQLLIINEMVRQAGIDITMVPVDIVRENDGLAMSSRNQRLSDVQRAVAPNIYRILKKLADGPISNNTEELKRYIREEIEAYPEMKLEYFEVADGNNLKPLSNITESEYVMGFIVVNLGDVRLIDNIRII